MNAVLNNVRRFRRIAPIVFVPREVVRRDTARETSPSRRNGTLLTDFGTSCSRNCATPLQIGWNGEYRFSRYPVWRPRLVYISQRRLHLVPFSLILARCCFLVSRLASSVRRLAKESGNRRPRRRAPTCPECAMPRSLEPLRSTGRRSESAQSLSIRVSRSCCERLLRCCVASRGLRVDSLDNDWRGAASSETSARGGKMLSDEP